MKLLSTLLSTTLLASTAGAAPAPAAKAPAPAAPGPAAAKAPAPAAPRRPAPRQTAAVEGITEHVLANGLRVLLFPDASKETVTVNLTYLVGSRMEGYGETGMAHLLEHMMFKGSPKHPKVWEELEQRGASNNASTWYDRTNYFETLPASDANLRWALELEADRMLNANIAAEDLAKEFSVVRNEFEIGENDPAQVLSERIWSTAYLWHNYGKSTIGSRADIEKVPATSLRRFYKKYYRPDNAVLLVTGKFDAAKALALVDELYAGLPNPPAPIEPTYTQEPVQDGERVVTLRRTGDVAVVGAGYHVSAAGDADFAAVQALADVLTAEPSGRLYAALVKTGLATSVSAGALPLHDPGLLEISAQVAPGKSADVVRDKLLAVVEGLAKAPVTTEELGRFKAKAKKDFKLAFANSGRLGIQLSEYIAAGDWRLLFLERDRVAALTPADVMKATAYLQASNRTVGTFVPTKAPERAPAKETPEVAKMVAGYQGAPPEAEGEKFEATIPNIEQRTTRRTLPSGMKLAFLDKQTRGHVVRAALTLRYGTEASLTGKRVATSMLEAVIARGTKKHTYQQLQDAWDALEAQVSFGSSPGNLTVNVQTTRANLPAVLALVDELLREATVPQDQLDIAIKEAVTALEDQRSDPQAQVVQAMTRALSPFAKTHPLYTPTTDEEIAELKALRAADVRAVLPLLGTSDATLTFVGDVDRAATTAWVEKTWGGWRSPRPFKRLAQPYRPSVGAEATLDFPDKANAMVFAAQTLELRDDDPDAAALEVANYVLGEGGFVSRLLTRMRQRDGLSYFAGSAVELSSWDRAGALFAYGALNPQNAKKGLAAMTEEIARLVSGGVTAEELAAAKQSLQAGFDRDLGNDGAVLRKLHEGQYLGRTMAWWAQRNEQIAKLTVDQVNAVIKRRIDPKAMLRYVAGDQKKF